MKPPDIRKNVTIRGTPVVLRTMMPADEHIETEFVRNLSDQSRYFRFHSALKELTPGMAESFTHVDYPDHMALIATITDGAEETQIAVTRYAKYPQREIAEVAIVVADDWQGHGLGRRMLLEIRDCAVDAGIHELHMSILAANHRMIQFAKELGYRIEPGDGSSSRELGKLV
ncbi:MAG: GNAT family N-acetyltransferase [Gammaproteobacteria bacterium]|jgi:acetyltransferase|nr:GNAT family N-acetyltransferase [Gammaproteobacteria bacterium]